MKYDIPTGAGVGMIFGAALGNLGAGLVLGAAAGLAVQKLRERRADQD